MPTVIDAEILSEERIPERPRAAPPDPPAEPVVHLAGAPRAVATAAHRLADSVGRMGATDTAAKLRGVAGVAEAVEAAADAAQPGLDALRDLRTKLVQKGWIGSSKRPPMGPRKGK